MNSFFTEIFVSKMISKVYNKLSVKKLLNILFSIKLENNIFNRFFTEIFVSPCIYKLITYIYIFSYLISLSQKRSVRHGIRTHGSLRCLQAVMNPRTLVPIYVSNWTFLGSLSFTELVHSIFLIFYNFHIL